MIEIQAPANLLPTSILDRMDAEQLDQLARDLADAARAKWIKLAQGDQGYGKHMVQDYIRGIQKPMVASGTAVIALVGEVANVLEHGDEGQDMRQTHLGKDVPVVPRGERGKHEAKEGGYYRAIPFRHNVPGASSGQVGQEMGVAYGELLGAKEAKRLGREVYGEAKQLSTGKTEGYSGRLQAGLAPKLRDHHKTDIFAGMIRERKTYEEAAQSQYMTFRTISTHVTGEDGERELATEGWSRAPIRGRQYAEQVADFVAKIAQDAAVKILEAG